MTRRVIAAILLGACVVALHAEAPILGQATMHNYPPGLVTLGVTAMGMTVAQASETTWVIESDGVEKWSVKVECTDKYSNGGVPLCDLPIPVQQDVARMRVRAAGSTEWSGIWLMAMVPCGHFVGEAVFRNSLEVMGWAHTDARGGECATIQEPSVTTPPEKPNDVRIVK